MEVQANKMEFLNHFEESLNSLFDFTKSQCYNTFSDNVGFIIEPSGWEYHNGMCDSEKTNLDRIIAVKAKKLSKDIVVDFLYVDNKIPDWINISIDESRSCKTVIRVLVSRKWRLFAEALQDYPEREIFHCVIPVPRGVDPEAGKYDVNIFRQQQDIRERGILGRLKWMFR